MYKQIFVLVLIYLCNSTIIYSKTVTSNTVVFKATSKSFSFGIQVKYICTFQKSKRNIFFVEPGNNSGIPVLDSITRNSSAIICTNNKGSILWYKVLTPNKSTFINYSLCSFHHFDEKLFINIESSKIDSLTLDTKLLPLHNETNAFLTFDENGEIIDNLVEIKGLKKNELVRISSINQEGSFVALLQQTGNLRVNNQPISPKKGLYLINFVFNKNIRKHIIQSENFVSELPTDKISKSKMFRLECVLTQNNQVLIYSSSDYSDLYKRLLPQTIDSFPLIHSSITLFDSKFKPKYISLPNKYLTEVSVNNELNLLLQYKNGTGNNRSIDCYDKQFNRLDSFIPNGYSVVSPKISEQLCFVEEEQLDSLQTIIIRSDTAMRYAQNNMDLIQNRREWSNLAIVVEMQKRIDATTTENKEKTFSIDLNKDIPFEIPIVYYNDDAKKRLTVWYVNKKNKLKKVFESGKILSNKFSLLKILRVSPNSIQFLYYFEDGYLFDFKKGSIHDPSFRNGLAIASVYY